jgi:uncharacterized membrane protein HdeD (DUF308 family)
MLKLMFRKWWLILIQGIILIILSIYIFNHPLDILAGISVWFSILVLAAGVIGIASWIMADREGREVISFLWSLATVILGIIMLLNLMATMKILTVIFGLWMLVTSLHLIESGWPMRVENALGWVLVGAGILSAVAAVMIIFNLASGAIGISTLLGIQTLLSGIALILLSFAKRMLLGVVRNKVTG